MTNDIKIKSARLSKREPNELTEFIFLATAPSIISVMRQARYMK